MMGMNSIWVVMLAVMHLPIRLEPVRLYINCHFHMAIYGNWINGHLPLAEDGLEHQPNLRWAALGLQEDPDWLHTF